MVYLILTFVFWSRSYGAGRDVDSPFDRSFRSLHVIPKLSANAPTSYWTLDWLTHPLKHSHVTDGTLHQPRMDVDSALCMHHLDECLSSELESDGTRVIDVGCHSPTETAFKKWSCAPSQNQSRYVHASGTYTEQKTCMAAKSQYHMAACQMQRMPEVSLVVNDDKTFSISSGHSQIVLLFYVSVIMFTVNLFAMISSVDYRASPMVPRFVRDNLRTCDQVKTAKQYIGAFVLLMLLLQRVFYSTSSRWLGMDWPKPNGTYFYGILAYFAVYWFAAKEDCLETSGTAINQVLPESEPKDASTSLSKAKTFGGSSTVNDNGSTKTAAPMQLNVSGFNGTSKLPTRSFIQPGAGKGYEIRDTSDLDTVTRQLVDSDYNETPFTSLWALTQLWVWPLMLLSAYIVKYNFQMDINVTVLFFGTFLFGLIELFSRRMLELKYLYKSALKSERGADSRAAHDFSIDTGVRLVYLLCLVVQLMVLLMVFWSANWNLGSWEYMPGVWITGAPGKYNRAEIIGTVKSFFLLYYFITLVYKLLCLLPDGPVRYVTAYGEMGKQLYQHLDAFCFTVMNILLTVLLILLAIWAAGSHSNMKYYDAGVYVRNLASTLS